MRYALCCLLFCLFTFKFLLIFLSAQGALENLDCLEPEFQYKREKRFINDSFCEQWSYERPLWRKADISELGVPELSRNVRFTPGSGH